MVDGVSEFRRFMYSTLPNAVEQAARRAMEQGAKELVDLMKSLVPVDQGSLRESIDWTWGDPPAGAMKVDSIEGSATGALRITIYAGGSSATKRMQARNSGTRASDQKRSGSFESDNARYQEFGTSKMPANPYFYPAYRALKKRIKSRITREINKAIRSL